MICIETTAMRFFSRGEKLGLTPNTGKVKIYGQGSGWSVW